MMNFFILGDKDVLLILVYNVQCVRVYLDSIRKIGLILINKPGSVKDNIRAKNVIKIILKYLNNFTAHAHQNKSPCESQSL